MVLLLGSHNCSGAAFAHPVSPIFKRFPTAALHKARARNPGAAPAQGCARVLPGIPESTLEGVIPTPQSNKRVKNGF